MKAGEKETKRMDLEAEIVEVNARIQRNQARYEHELEKANRWLREVDIDKQLLILLQKESLAAKPLKGEER